MRVAILIIAAGTLQAQEYRATVLGTVPDPAGAAVPGAAVAVTNNESSVTSRTRTNNDGAFQVPYLVPGLYSIEAIHAGVKTYRRSPVELHVDDRVKIEIALEIGRAAEQVTVTAETPVLEEAN